ncbi:MAG: LCP family protein [Patescibacteria group bacterium]|nr:LCP family protein [Patescibacteria group bacterium]
MKNIDSLEPKKPTPPQINSRVGLPDFRPQANTPELSLLKPSLAPKKRHRVFKTLFVTILLAILILGGLVVSKAMNLSDKIFVGQKYSFLQKIQFAIRGTFGGTTLVGEDLGQINILLLGIGGEGHDGPYLTDTMIVAQIRPDIGEATLTSLPRDYLVELPNNLGYRKINAAFAEGYNLHKDYNEAGQWATQTTEKVTGLKLPYFAVIDFTGFEKAIDLLGGVDVNVDRTFTDAQFPDSGIGYLPPITFKQGPAHLDGKTALEFARSRHGNNGEGSDFARSLRQQKVISAFKTKAFSLNLITDSGKINSLLNTFADHFHTNINPGEIFRLYSLMKEKNIQKFLSSSLDEETGLICPKIMEGTGAWVLVACPGKTESDIQNYFKNSFTVGRLKEEGSVVWLGTSTGDKTEYNQVFKTLKGAGLTVWEVGYSQGPLTENLVYQVNPKPATTEFIKNELHAVEVTTPPPGIKIDKDKVDLVVLLGQKN